MSRMRLLSIAVLAVAAAIAVPSAKADTFQYHVTNTGESLNVTFDLPSFEDTANNITTFESGSTLLGVPLEGFAISGNSSNCFEGGTVALGGNCWIAENTALTLEVGFGSPSFSGPGTFISGGTTVTITDIPSSPTPEPTSLLLMGSGLLGLAGYLRRK